MICPECKGHGSPIESESNGAVIVNDMTCLTCFGEGIITVDLMQLIEQLQERVIELAAIKQAAFDYVTLEKVIPINSSDDEIKQLENAAYDYLKSLVYE